MLRVLSPIDRVEPTFNNLLADSEDLRDRNAASRFVDAPAPEAVASKPTLVVVPSTADYCESITVESRHCYLVTYVKFKPGTAHEARRIMSEHFWPIDRALHRRLFPFDLQLGDWDYVVYVEFKDAPGQFDWLPSALTTRWLEHFHEREGGRDKAEAIARRYNELVAHCKHELAIGAF
jgi:hypothetical protein